MFLNFEKCLRRILILLAAIVASRVFLALPYWRLLVYSSHRPKTRFLLGRIVVCLPRSFQVVQVHCSVQRTVRDSLYLYLTFGLEVIAVKMSCHAGGTCTRTLSISICLRNRWTSSISHYRYWSASHRNSMLFIVFLY